MACLQLWTVNTNRFLAGEPGPLLAASGFGRIFRGLARGLFSGPSRALPVGHCGALTRQLGVLSRGQQPRRQAVSVPGAALPWMAAHNCLGGYTSQTVSPLASS